MAERTIPSCTLIGILDDGWAGLSEAARARLAGAGVVIGAGRTLALVRPQLADDVRLHDMDGALTQLPAWIAIARADARPAVVLATGDPLCHGIAAWLSQRLAADGLASDDIEVLPNVSTLQLACARFHLPWQDVRIASCHGRDSGEWPVGGAGATPAHGLYATLRAIALQPLVFVFTGPENDPARLARALLAVGYGSDEIRLSVACRLQLPDERLFAQLSLADAAHTDFPTPNVVVVQRRALAGAGTGFGRDDNEYRQRMPEKGLITKQEARAVSLARLRLAPDAVVWDIGAGSGSVGLEAASLAPHGHVWAIEKNAEAAADARANARSFRLSNYSLFDGKAPQHLDTWPAPDAVFVGGSGGELAALIRLILGRLKTDGRLVMNFVTLENLAVATTELAAAGVTWEVVQLQASRSQPILGMHRLAAQNPVWIVSARKAPPTPQSMSHATPQSTHPAGTENDA